MVEKIKHKKAQQEAARKEAASSENRSQASSVKKQKNGPAKEKKAVKDVKPIEVNDIGSEASHSFATQSNASDSHESAFSKSQQFNSDLGAKDFVKQKQSTGTSKGTGKNEKNHGDYELNYETRDVPFQVKDE